MSRRRVAGLVALVAFLAGCNVGFIDEVKTKADADGNVEVTVRGWAATEEGERVDEFYVLYAGRLVETVEIERTDRPDVVRAGRADHVKSGFVIRFTVPESEAKCQTVRVLVVDGSPGWLDATPGYDSYRSPFVAITPFIVEPLVLPNPYAVAAPGCGSSAPWS